MDKSRSKTRRVFLGDHSMQLQGDKPKPGKRILGCFHANPARKTRAVLNENKINRGLVIISTLPNIRSFACSQQVLDLELEVRAHLPEAKIYHIASDPKSGWDEVEKLHPFLKSPGFTLVGVDKSSVESFKKEFGVGVEGNKRIAHGLFALKNGEFLVSYIPRQQYGVPNIKRFVNRVKDRLLYAQELSEP
ncbi:hypothetical protein [Leptospira sp. GIMC2001]|uniref:hypothetical protein n=1 Tax=Leptospira sp. GIMC2001 TaxID=1513297 RepID=UPI0023499CB0|nr:hypothetical protein [Leptospira sp. GIMC2001]WCL50010.1 hypothetical protein O4O04_04105 [Leptospira sp. GIMC2001]